MHPSMPPASDGTETATAQTKSQPRARSLRLRERARSLWSSEKFMGAVHVTLFGALGWGLTFMPPRTILPFALITVWVGWLTREQLRHQRRDRPEIERLQREVLRLGRNINPCRSRLNQSPPMLERWVFATKGSMPLRIDPPAEPTCGVDFCRKCGACLVCYGARPCDSAEDATTYGRWESRHIIHAPEGDPDIARSARAALQHSWVYVQDEPARDEFQEIYERYCDERLRRVYSNQRG